MFLTGDTELVRCQELNVEVVTASIAAMERGAPDGGGEQGRADGGAGPHSLNGGQEITCPAHSWGLRHDDQCAVPSDRRKSR